MHSEPGTNSIAPRLTKWGKPAKSTYRKLNLGTERRDEHRVIMERILGRRLTSREVVHHINGDQYDNRPENLQLMSLSEHTRLHNLGERCQFAVLKESQVREIMASTLPQRATARLFGVSKSTVADIKRGRSWSHLFTESITEPTPTK